MNLRITSLLFVVFCLLFFDLGASIENQFRKFATKTGSLSPEGVDFTYLINLDQRPERLDSSLKELSRFAIFPQRFPAIYGWDLFQEQLQDIGLVFAPWMTRLFDYALELPPDRYGKFVQQFFDETSIDKTIFSKWTSRGAIGCTLSHLSVLQDAYDAGYEIIWIVEDDIRVVEDPHELSDLIGKLTRLVPDWDLLFTDGSFSRLDPKKTIQEQIPMMWRPDLPEFDLDQLRNSPLISSDFRKISHRMCTHSILYRRSGIEKILQFYKKRGMFIPYDHELFFVPNLSVFGLTKEIIGIQSNPSDTIFHFF